MQIGIGARSFKEWEISRNSGAELLLPESVQLMEDSWIKNNLMGVSYYEPPVIGGTVLFIPSMMSLYTGPKGVFVSSVRIKSAVGEAFVGTLRFFFGESAKMLYVSNHLDCKSVVLGEISAENVRASLQGSLPLIDYLKRMELNLKEPVFLNRSAGSTASEQQSVP